MSRPFAELFDDFQHTAFRLEARPLYNVGGAEVERIAAFREHRPRPERSVRTEPWLARIARTTGQGRRWLRVRVVDQPLTDYQRYQLLGGSYVENQAVGEEIHLITRAAAMPWLQPTPDHSPIGDFWLFDHGYPTQRLIAWEYTDDGRPVDRREVTEADGTDWHDMLAAATELVHHAAPLADYLASLKSAETGVA